MVQKRMPQKELIQTRIDRALKEDAEILFERLGMDTPTAIRIFLRQSVMKGGLPFDVRLVPNAETIAAMEEAKKLAADPTAKRYDSFSEVLAEVEVENDDAV